MRAQIGVSLAAALLALAQAIGLDREGTTLLVGPAHFTGAQHLESEIAEDLGSGDFSISAWIKTRHGGTIWSKHHGGSWEGQSKSLFVYRAGNVAFDVGMVGQIETKETVHDDQWHHVVLTYKKSGNLATLYLDGELAVADEIPTKPDPDDHVIKIGHTGLNFGGNFRGYMRNVILVPSVLGRDRILQLFADNSHGDIENHGRVELSGHVDKHTKCAASVSHRREDSHPPDVHPNYRPATDTMLDSPTDTLPLVSAEEGLEATRAAAQAKARGKAEEATSQRQAEQPSQTSQAQVEAARHQAAQRAKAEAEAAAKAEVEAAKAEAAAEQGAKANAAQQEEAAKAEAAKAEAAAAAAAKAEAEAKAQAEAEAAAEKAQAEAEAKAQAEAEAKAQAEAEAATKAAAEAEVAASVEKELAEAEAEAQAAAKA